MKRHLKLLGACALVGAAVALAVPTFAWAGGTYDYDWHNARYVDCLEDLPDGGFKQFKTSAECYAYRDSLPEGTTSLYQVHAANYFTSGDTYTEPTSGASVSRFWGDNAVATSIDISHAFNDNKCDDFFADKTDVAYSHNVVLASSADFRDAMSATGLAGALDAQIMLVDKNEGITDELLREIIQGSTADNVYIVGGPGALATEKIEGVIEASGWTSKPNCIRVYGDSAADTSVACAKKIAEITGETPKYAVVARSDNFADALSFSSFAYAYKVPILLETPGNSASERHLTDEAISILNGVTDEIFVAGGTSSISDESLSAVNKNVTRISGNSRYDTSNQIADFLVTAGFLTTDTVTIACGDNQSRGVDALAGAALAGQQKGVILLASGTKFSADDNTAIIGSDSEGTASFLMAHNNKINQVNVLGGTTVCTDYFMHDTIATALATTPDNTEIAAWFSDVNEADWYVTQGVLYSAYTNGFVYGYGNGTLGAYDTLTRAQAATFFWRLAGEPTQSDYTAFDDCDYSSWYGEAIKWARTYEVVMGYEGSNNFGPNDPVTREQLAVMFSNYYHNYLGQDSSYSSTARLNDFPDGASVNSWAQVSVNWCVENGIISGVETSSGKYLQPQANTQRCMMMAMLVRFNNAYGDIEPTTPDNGNEGNPSDEKKEEEIDLGLVFPGDEQWLLPKNEWKDWFATGACAGEEDGIGYYRLRGLWYWYIPVEDSAREINPEDLLKPCNTYHELWMNEKQYQEIDLNWKEYSYFDHDLVYVEDQYETYEYWRKGVKYTETRLTVHAHWECEFCGNTWDEKPTAQDLSSWDTTDEEKSCYWKENTWCASVAIHQNEEADRLGLSEQEWIRHPVYEFYLPF